MKKMNTQFLTPGKISAMSSVTSTKKSLKEEIMDEIIKKLMEKLQGMVEQNVQDKLKNIKTSQIKNLRHGKNEMNSEGTSTNTKVKQRTL
jgi:hypothetical protein